MAIDIEILLRIAAEISQLEPTLTETEEILTDELSANELDLVSAARQEPVLLPPAFRKNDSK